MADTEPISLTYEHLQLVRLGMHIRANYSSDGRRSFPVLPLLNGNHRMVSVMSCVH